LSFGTDVPRHRSLAYGGAFVEPLELTILIVEDWPNADLLGQILGLKGHTIHLANNGQEAMEKARQCKPDVVFIDVALPRMTGLDLARILSDQGDKKPLLIALSGFSSKEDKAKAYKAGFDHFFTKPMDLDDFMLILEEKENYLFISKRELVGD
jgi:CheY-like chemotaxis protein